MLGLLILWAALLVALVVLAIGRSGRGGALTLAYFLGLSLVHMPGVLPFLDPESSFVHRDETQLGLELTTQGMATFVVGAVVARWIHWRRAAATSGAPRRRAHAFERLGWRAFAFGVVAFVVLLPLSRSVPSANSVVGSVMTMQIIGLWLLLYGAALAGDQRRTLLTLALVPLLPLMSLVTNGFLSFGTFWSLSVVTFLFVITKRRIWFYVAALPAVFLGLSLFVTWTGQRMGIREVTWHEQASLLDRLDRDWSIISEFELLDLSSPRHATALDDRLNQNYFVGTGIIYHEIGAAGFAYGATVPPWALIPRAVWPDKPAVGGGGTLVSDFTGIQCAVGTSCGAGQVLEFYVNFGIPGVLIGFFGLGYLLMRLDQGIMRRLASDDIRGFLMRAMPGLVLMQPQGNLLEIIVGCVAAYVVARLVIRMRFFDVPLPARSRRQMA
jgi:hypothetical protein